MARHRSFTTGPPPERDDYVTFDVSGLTTTAHEPWSETFTALPVAPAGVLDDLTSAMRVDPETGRRRYAARSTLDFIGSVLVEDDRPRFNDLMRDTERIVALTEAVDILIWLSDVLTMRPTRPSSVSTNGGATAEDEGASTEAAAS